MSTRLSAGRVRATYEFIKAHRHEYGVHTMCRVLEVAPSGYLRLAQAADLEASAGGCQAASPDPRVVHLRASMARHACSWICVRPANPAASIAWSALCG